MVKLVDNGNMAQSKIVFVCKLTSASCSRFVLKLEHSLITLLTINVFHLFKQKVARDNLTDKKKKISIVLRLKVAHRLYSPGLYSRENKWKK